MARAVRVLARLTGQLAVVEYPSLRLTALRHLELVALGPTRVLLVIITDTGRVEQRTVVLSGEGADVVDPLALERLRLRLNSALVGRRAAEAVPILAALSRQAPVEERTLLAAVTSVLLDALRPDAEERFVVAGTANLARSTPDFSALGALLDAIEEQVVLLKLLGAAAADLPGDVAVRIGEENPYGPLRTTSVVASSYGPSDSPAHLGIVGPTRMDYPSTMAIVRAVARYVGQFLTEG